MTEEQRASEVSDSADPATHIFGEHRQLLLRVAYRILGQVSDADDVVQEAWLRWASVEYAAVSNPKAFLIQVTSRLAIDRLRREKARREAYVGPWLPEPLLTSPDVADQVELADSVSFALSVVLETLSPLERAVFVLREAFGLSHVEIAEALGRSEVAVRQVASRARSHVDAKRARFDSDAATRRSVTERFLAASTSGNLAMLMGVLAPGVELVADSGGKIRAPRLPVRGAQAVTRFLSVITRKEAIAGALGLPAGEPAPEISMRLMDFVGGPGIVAFVGGEASAVFILDVIDGRVQAIHVVANPDKLLGISGAAN